MIVKVLNNLTQEVPFTYIQNGSSIGAGSVNVRNTSGFTNGHAIQLGKTGEEKTEIVVMGSATASGTTFVLSGTTKFDHPADTPVFDVSYDKVVFNVSTSGTSGTATPITDGTVLLSPDNEYTSFDHTSGLAGYGYRAYFYNSNTGGTSDISDWITSDGYSFYSLYSIRERAKSKLRSASFIKDDATVDDWINEWMERMNNVLVDVNKDYGLGTVDISFGADGMGTINNADYKDIRRMWITYNGNDFYSATKMDLNDFSQQDIFSGVRPFFYFYGDNSFGVKPEDGGGTARVTYYKIRTPLSNDTDELPVPMRSYSKSFVDYALGQAYYLDKQTVLGDKFNSAAENDLELFRTEVTPRSKTGPEYIKLVENTYDDADGAIWYP